jgi:hypothetical protein
MTQEPILDLGNFEVGLGDSSFKGSGKQKQQRCLSRSVHYSFIEIT